MAAIPYEKATSGAAARDEISRLLRRMGCESVGFMDQFDRHSVTLAFQHRGRPIQLEASAKGWAARESARPSPQGDQGPA
jgi:thiamine biosynthesis lipoprotein ApbE